MGRIKNLCKKINEHDEKIDAVLVVNSPDENFFYLTNFESGEFGNCFAILFPDGKLDTYVSKLEYGIAKKQNKKTRLIDRRPDELITKSLKGIRDIGIIGDKIPYSHAMLLKRKKINLHDVSKIFNNARLIKDKDEIKKIRTASKITANVFEILRQRKLKLESDYAAEIEYLFRKNNCETAFPVICAADKNSSYPHYATGKAKINKMILLDFGAKFKKYCSDMTRCLIFKETPAIRKANEIVMKSYDAALGKVEEFSTGIEIHDAAEKILKSSLIHSIGHFFGLEIHEGSLSRLDNPIKPGMVFTIEPGYYKNGKVGIRYEDDILITKNGFKVLTKLSRYESS